jgi:hypothetical protein
MVSSQLQLLRWVAMRGWGRDWVCNPSNAELQMNLARRAGHTCGSRMVAEARRYPFLWGDAVAPWVLQGARLAAVVTVG